MFLDLNDKVNVSRFHIGQFVRHAPKGNFGIVRHALFDVDFQDFAFRLGLGGAALSATVGTLPLDLRDHAGSQLAHFHLHALAVAGRTRFGLAHDDFAINGQFDRFAIVQVLQRNFDGMLDTGRFAGSRAATATTAAKEHAEQVFRVATGSAATIFESFQSEFVVSFPLFGVAQNFVRRIDFFEFVFVAALVGVVHLGEAKIRLFDFLGRGRLVDFERFVQFGRVGGFAASATARHTAGHSTGHSAGKVFKGNSTKHCCFVVYCCVLCVVVEGEDRSGVRY